MSTMRVMKSRRSEARRVVPATGPNLGGLAGLTAGLWRIDGRLTREAWWAVGGFILEESFPLPRHRQSISLLRSRDTTTACAFSPLCILLRSLPTLGSHHDRLVRTRQLSHPRIWSPPQHHPHHPPNHPDPSTPSPRLSLPHACSRLTPNIPPRRPQQCRQNRSPHTPRNRLHSQNTHLPSTTPSELSVAGGYHCGEQSIQECE